MGYKDEMKIIEQLYDMLKIYDFYGADVKFGKLDKDLHNEIDKFDMMKGSIKDVFFTNDGMLNLPKTGDVQWNAIKGRLKTLTDSQEVNKTIERLQKASDEEVKSEEWRSMYQFFLTAGSRIKGFEVEQYKADQARYLENISFINSATQRAAEEWNTKVVSVAEKAKLNIAELDQKQAGNKRRIKVIDEELSRISKGNLYNSEMMKKVNSELSLWKNLSDVLGKRTFTEQEKAQFKSYAADIDAAIKQEKTYTAQDKADVEAFRKYSYDLDKMAKAEQEKKELYDNIIKEETNAAMNDQVRYGVVTATKKCANFEMLKVQFRKAYTGQFGNFARTPEKMDGLKQNIIDALGLTEEQLGSLDVTQVGTLLEKGAEKAQEELRAGLSKVSNMESLKYSLKMNNAIRAAREYASVLVSVPDKGEYEKLLEKPAVQAQLKADKACQALKDLGIGASIFSITSMEQYKNCAENLATIDKAMADSRKKEAEAQYDKYTLEGDKSREKYKNLEKEKVNLEKELNTINELNINISTFEANHSKNLEKREQMLNEMKVKTVTVENDLIRQAGIMHGQREFKKGMHIDSSEYKKMMNSLKMVTEWNNKEVMGKIREKNNGTPKTLEDAFKLLHTAADGYLKAKEAQTRHNPSSLRTSRLTLAANILSFAEKSQSMIKDAETINKNAEILDKAKEQKFELKGRVAEKAAPEMEKEA